MVSGVVDLIKVLVAAALLAGVFTAFQFFASDARRDLRTVPPGDDMPPANAAPWHGVPDFGAARRGGDG